VTAEEAAGKFAYTNRLIDEKNPYLQLHAHHPVNWFLWGDEVFQKARRKKKHIFLSIGYSTCHWCHVMEEESRAMMPPKAGLALRRNGRAVDPWAQPALQEPATS